MKEVFVNGCKAGVVAGFLWGVCLLLGSSPIILEAVTYETAHSHTSGVQLAQVQHSTSGFLSKPFL